MDSYDELTNLIKKEWALNGGGISVEGMDRIRRAAVVEAIRGVEFFTNPKHGREALAGYFESQFPGITEDATND